MLFLQHLLAINTPDFHQNNQHLEQPLKLEAGRDQTVTDKGIQHNESYNHNQGIFSTSIQQNPQYSQNSRFHFIQSMDQITIHQQNLQFQTIQVKETPNTQLSSYQAKLQKENQGLSKCFNNQFFIRGLLQQNQSQQNHHITLQTNITNKQFHLQQQCQQKQILQKSIQNYQCNLTNSIDQQKIYNSQIQWDYKINQSLQNSLLLLEISNIQSNALSLISSEQQYQDSSQEQINNSALCAYQYFIKCHHSRLKNNGSNDQISMEQQSLLMFENSSIEQYNSFIRQKVEQISFVESIVFNDKYSIFSQFNQSFHQCYSKLKQSIQSIYLGNLPVLSNDWLQEDISFTMSFISHQPLISQVTEHNLITKSHNNKTYQQTQQQHSLRQNELYKWQQLFQTIADQDKQQLSINQSHIQLVQYQNDNTILLSYMEDQSQIMIRM